MELDVATAERVSLSLPIAGVGHRAMACLVDSGLLFAAALSIYFVYSLVGTSLIDLIPSLSTAARVAGAIALFGLQWGYWAAFEALWQGQTPGKRLLRIRVVKVDGSPIGPLEALTRNLVRAVDFLPTAYALGLTVMLIDRQHRRLGDLAAGTLLLRDEAVDLSRYAPAQTGAETGKSHKTAQEIELVTGFLARFDALEDGRRSKLGLELLRRLGSHAQPATPEALRAALTAWLAS